MKVPAMVLLLNVPLGSWGLEVTPIQKVLELLAGMKAKAEEEKHKEKVAYAGFKQFCDMNIPLKQEEITKTEEMIEMLEADIEKHTAEAEQLGKEVAQHDADINGWQEDEEAAKTVRD